LDKRLLDCYNRELAYLRMMGADFAKAYPKIAGRLGGLDAFQACPDPFVERLLEGFAFLAARVQLKQEAEFPRFTQSLLETVYPHYLAPTPSMCMVQFEPDLSEPALAEGFLLERGMGLSGMLGETEQTRCQYYTAHDVTLWPLQVAEARYLVRELSTLNMPVLPGGKAAIRIRLPCPGGQPLRTLALDSLVFHLVGAGELPMAIYEQLFAHCLAAGVRSEGLNGGRLYPLEPNALRPVGFAQEQSLLPYDARTFQGYRLLREYFAFPQRFLFAEIAGLQAALRGCDSSECDLILVMDRANLALEESLNGDHFKLHCAPAINLFPKRLDRIQVSDKTHEFHVVPDRTRSQDFEIYRLTQVLGHGLRADQVQEFRPFYCARDLGERTDHGYYVCNRVPRPQSQRERQRGRRSSRYGGSEVYLSLVDANAAPYRSDLQQLSVEALCTNRDLPLHMPTSIGASDFTMEKTVPCLSVRCVGSPTAPMPSHAEGEIAWRAVSHLSLNYYSLTDGPRDSGAAALRDILRLYCPPDHPHQVEGLKSITSRPVMRRLPTPQAIAFVRGVEVTVTLEEAAFTGSGVFLLGAVLEQFFARYVSINTFTETVLKSVERGEIKRWPLRSGLRPVL
jgi:type VI secretion system protein ImpG